MKDTSYLSVINGVETIHSSFEEAFRKVYEHVKLKLEKKNLTSVEIENQLFIKLPNDVVLNYLQARERAVEDKILFDND